MTYVGRVKNGVVVLPPDANIPEGTQVTIIPIGLTAEEDPFLDAVRKVTKPRPHWPADYILNHGFYVSGEPEKS